MKKILRRRPCPTAGRRAGSLLAGAQVFAILTFGLGTLWATPPNVEIPPLEFKPAEADRIVLKNGAVVYLKEDHELPIFDMRLWIHVSPADEAVHDTYSFFGPVWRAGGTKLHAPEKLNEILERMPASVETGADEEALSVSVGCLSKDIEKSLELFTEVLLQPDFQENQIALERSKKMESLLRKNETPSQIARRAFRDVVYGKDHIYAYEPTPVSLKKVSRANLLALHKLAVVPDQAMFAISGDFKKDEMIATLERLLKDWKPSGRSVPAYDYSPKSPVAGRVFFVQKDAAQSRITIAHLGPARHAPDHFTLSVADYILGGGGPSRLFGEIRSRQGLAYMVGSFVLEFKGPGLIGVACQTKSASTVAAAQAIMDQLKKFAEAPVSGAELALAKDSLRNSYVFNFDSTSEVVGARAANEFYGFTGDYIDIYMARLDNVSAEDVLKAAQNYYAPKLMKMMIVGNQLKFETPLSTLGDVTVIPLEQIN